MRWNKRLSGALCVSCCVALGTVLVGCGDSRDKLSITVTVEPAGAGTVTLDPPGGVYEPGTVVTLHALAGDTYYFGSWAGEFTGNANPVEITVDADKAVTVRFFWSFNTDSYYSLSWGVTGGTGSVDADPPGQTLTLGYPVYPQGTIITVTAIPGPGYVFSEWIQQPTYGGIPDPFPSEYDYLPGAATLSTDNPVQITMDVDRCAYAYFIPDDRFTLDVTVSPPEGGSVTVAPPPSDGTYGWGAIVTLTAEPVFGYAFTGWSGDRTGIQSTTALDMKANKAVTASFVPVHWSQFTLTVLVTAEEDWLLGTVAVMPDPPGGVYDPGTVVSLPIYQNGSWEGVDETGEGWSFADGYTVTMNADKVVTLHLVDLSWQIRPICQAHKLLDRDPVVRIVAEELLFMMGERQLGYMNWAAGEARPELAERIREAATSIREGARPDPSRWPTSAECVERLWSCDGVAAIMAAQMLRAIQVRNGEKFVSDVEARVAALLVEARSRSLAGPWRR